MVSDRIFWGNFVAMRNIEMTGTNAMELLRWLRPGHPSSRAALAERSGLSSATIARFTHQLLEDGWLNEVTREASQVGRPAQWLQLSGERGAVLGVSLMQPAIQVVCCDLNAGVIFDTRESLDLKKGAPGVLGALERSLKGAACEAAKRKLKLRRLGVALPGQWDPSTGFSRTYPRVPEWSDVPVRDLAAGWSGLATSLHGYAASLAVGELARRPDPVPRHMLCVEVADNIAMGIVSNGGVVEGVCGNAGELGHITIDPDGPVCYCGNRGCLETMATCTAVEDEIRQSDVARDVFKTPKQMNFDDVVQHATKGNGFAQRMVQRCSRTLGLGLAVTANLFNPQKLVLSGRFFRQQELVLEPIAAAIKEHTLPNVHGHLEVEVSVFRENAAAHGAAMAALHETLVLLGQG
jgi:predicted NBD/HSP70 family sugar kinase